MDAFLLDLLEDRIFAARDFAELPNGICRIAAPLTHELALTLPHWRECLRPIAAGLAQTFRDAHAGKGKPPRESGVEAIAARSDASQSLAAAAVCRENMALITARSARSQSDCVRIMRAAGAQAQAPLLRSVFTASTP